MAKELSEDSKFQISIKTLGGIAAGLSVLIGMWFTLQADIAEAKELPQPPPSEVTRMEFDMKDQMARNQIDALVKEVDELKEEIKELRK